MALSGPVCVCVWILLSHAGIFLIHNVLWPSQYKQSREMEYASDVSIQRRRICLHSEMDWGRSIHVPANKTVDFCSFMSLFAFRILVSYKSADSELVREILFIELAWHSAHLARFLRNPRRQRDHSPDVPFQTHVSSVCKCKYKP